MSVRQQCSMDRNEHPQIRPWYRSRIFWFGALGFLVISWSWRDSFEYVRSIHTPDRVEPGTSIVGYYSFHTRVGIVGVTHESADYSIRRNSALPNRGFTTDSSQLSGLGWENLRKNNPSPFQLPILTYHETDKEIRTSYFYMAHWFLLLVYCGGCAVLYAFRNSRIRRTSLQRQSLTTAEASHQMTIIQQHAVGIASQNLQAEQDGGGNALEPPSHPSTAPSKSRATP